MERSQAHREGANQLSSSICQAPITWEVSSPKRDSASLLFITGRLTEGVTRKTWLANKHAGVDSGTAITWVCHVICCCFLQGLTLTPVLQLRESFIWREFMGDLLIAQLQGRPEVFFCLLIARDGEPWSSADYICQWSLGLEHKIDHWHANIRKQHHHQPATWASYKTVNYI